jgi:hypothetical protein
MRGCQAVRGKARSGRILGSVGASLGGDAGVALSDSFIANESIELVLDEIESSRVRCIQVG